MANLPTNKKLKKVSFVYEDGSTYLLDEKNSVAFQNNINATSVIAVRSYNPFAPVEWIEAGREGANIPTWITPDVTEKVLDILNNSEGKVYVQGKGNAKAEALQYLLELSKENNDRSNFGIKKCVDYIDSLTEVKESAVNHHRDVRFPSEEDMNCPSCEQVTPHSLKPIHTHDLDSEEKLWTCVICDHQRMR